MMNFDYPRSYVWRTFSGSARICPVFIKTGVIFCMIMHLTRLTAWTFVPILSVGIVGDFKFGMVRLRV